MPFATNATQKRISAVFCHPAKILIVLLAIFFAGCTTGTWLLNEKTGDKVKDTSLLFFARHNGTLEVPSKKKFPDVNVEKPKWLAATSKQKGLDFKGSHGWVEVPGQESLQPETFTLEAWVRRCRHNPRWRVYDHENIVQYGHKNDLNAYYSFYTQSYRRDPDNRGVAFYIRHKPLGTTMDGRRISHARTLGCKKTKQDKKNSGVVVKGIPNECPGFPVWDGDWHQIVGTYDGERPLLYVDGELASELTDEKYSIDYPEDPATSYFLIGNLPREGRTGFSSDRDFQGQVSRVKLWSRTLGANEIRYRHWLTKNQLAREDSGLGCQLPK